MFIFQLLALLMGYIEISARGDYLERFLNLCSRSGIRFWRITKSPGGRLSLCMFKKDFKKLRPIVRKCGARVHIEKKVGLPFLLHRYRRRYALFIGMAAFFVIIYVMSGFVWSIEVLGAEKLDADELIETLRGLGFAEGTPKGGVDLDSLHRQMLLEAPELSWIAINIKGSKAVVEIRERVAAPEMMVGDGPCNVVAAADGQIISIDAYSGRALVKPGDSVKAGDLCVTGVLDSNVQGMRLVTAKAKIMARTWRYVEESCPLSYTEMRRTGEEKKRYSLRILNFNINLFWDSGAPYATYDKIESVSDARIGDIYLPMALVTETYCETRAVEVSVPLEQAQAICEASLDEFRAGVMQAGELIRDKREVRVENGVVTIGAEFECIEDIARQEEILTAESPLQEHYDQDEQTTGG